MYEEEEKQIKEQDKINDDLFVNFLILIIIFQLILLVSLINQYIIFCIGTIFSRT